MNLFGKILVALNLVMSLVFMGFAVAVYSTHKNWRLVTEDLNAKITALGNEKKGQLDTIETLTKTIDFERKLRDSSDQILKTKAEVAKAELDAVNQKLTALQETRADTTAMVTTLSAQMQLKNDEITAVGRAVEALKVENEDVFKKLLEANANIARLNAEKSKLIHQIDGLVGGGGTTTGPGTIDPTKPLVLDGIVRDATTDGLVEISLGSDDGVTRGMSMYVYRPGATPAATKLLGRIEILQTHADVSIGKVIPEYRKGNIEKDDRVATRFN